MNKQKSKFRKKVIAFNPLVVLSLPSEDEIKKLIKKWLVYTKEEESLVNAISQVVSMYGKIVVHRQGNKA